MKTFLKGVFSEPDGSPSFTRVFTGIIVGFACGWVTSIVKHAHALPEFAGLIGFIGVLYGLNRAGKVGDALTKDGKSE